MKILLGIKTVQIKILSCPDGIGKVDKREIAHSERERREQIEGEHIEVTRVVVAIKVDKAMRGIFVGLGSKNRKTLKGNNEEKNEKPISPFHYRRICYSASCRKASSEYFTLIPRLSYSTLSVVSDKPAFA